MRTVLEVPYLINKTTDSDWSHLLPTNTTRSHDNITVITCASPHFHHLHRHHPQAPWLHATSTGFQICRRSYGC